MKLFKSFFTLILIILLVGGFFVARPFIENIQNEMINNLEKLPEATDIPPEIQFLPNLKFNHNNISYKYEGGCESRKEKMRLAFQTIQNLSSEISFYETNNKADINIFCSKETIQKSENVFLAGEGGPNEIINLSNYPLILQGSIDLYEQQNVLPCENPIVEIHELLHVLGYNHQSNKTSVLYPYYHCNQKIPQEIISHLDNLYSQEPKADLFFSKLTAKKHSDYLDYDLEIKNEGPIPAEEVFLTIKSGNIVIEKTDFSTINSGNGKTYTVQNQKIPSNNINKITFTITTITDEYSTENNLQIVSI